MAGETEEGVKLIFDTLPLERKITSNQTTINNHEKTVFILGHRFRFLPEVHATPNFPIVLQREVEGSCGLAEG